MVFKLTINKEVKVMILTVPVVAKLIGVAERTLRYWCETGKIPAKQVAVKKVQNRKRKGRWYIHWSWVEERLKEAGLIDEHPAIDNAIVFQKVVQDIIKLNLLDCKPKERLEALLNYYEKHPEENPVAWIKTNSLPIAINIATKDIIKPYISLPKKTLKNKLTLL